MNKDILIEQINNVYEKRSFLESLVNDHKKIIILGNGGSNTIASHIAIDYIKVLNKVVNVFSDAGLITCFGNDFEYKNANLEFVKRFTEKNTLVIIISSSGNSENMLNVQKYCQDNDIDHVILTGFDENNKMRKLNETTHRTANLDLWVNSTNYGIVECVHQIFLHSIVGK